MGLGNCTGCHNHGMVSKACALYFALGKYIHAHIPAYISMHVQCLGEGKNFSLTCVKLFCILCKNSFPGGHRKIFLKIFPQKHRVIWGVLSV